MQPGIPTSLHPHVLPDYQDIDHFRYTLTEEAQGYLALGAPEAQVFNAVPAEGLPMPALKASSRQQSACAMCMQSCTASVPPGRCGI